MQQESDTLSPLSVPWKGLDVLLLLALWLAPLCISVAGTSIASLTQSREPAAAVEANDHGHPVKQLVEQGKKSSIVFLVAFLSAVVVAPLVEEFLFRLLLQGWLEAKFAQFRVPCASGVAIVAVSIFFAVIHGGSHHAGNVETLLYALVASMIFSLLILTTGIIYLARKRNVKLIPCFFGTERFFHPQFFANTGYCLLALVFIFGLTAVLITVYPNTNISPIPIFFFSLLLGTLYSRTRNLSYCILLHALLNGTSLTIAWLAA
jgi:membrane protease YdiL (CAAX protease family)